MTTSENIKPLGTDDYILITDGALRGQIVQVGGIDFFTMKPLVNGHTVDGFIALTRSTEAMPGTIVRIIAAGSLATDDYKQWVVGRVATVTKHSVQEGVLTVRMGDAFSETLPAGHLTTVSRWAPVGFTESADHKDFIDWKSAFDNLSKKWDILWEGLNEKAQEHDWCSEYDEFALTHGGPERRTKIEADVNITRTVSASDLDKVMGPMLLPETSGLRVDVQDDVTLVHRVEAEVEVDGQIDLGVVEEAVKAWLNKSNIDYDDFDIIDWSHL